MEFLQRTARPPPSLLPRMRGAIWRQRALTPTCPDAPRLDGQLALVTGGNAGIGLETSLGLARRGAEVVIAARREAPARAALQRLAAETGGKGHFVPLDLSDLRTVAPMLDALGRLAGGRKVDRLVANAGVAPREYAVSPQGHELAFATNTLGHHLLIRRLLDRGWLTGGRVVLVTGDIYIMEKDCTPDFQYRGARGGQAAYSRSKLGTLWEAHELARRHPELEVVVVHPGVVASGLVATPGLLRWLFLEPVAGAQTTLIAATQPGVRDAYLHNTLGRVELAPEDPAMDARKAAALWETMERLCAPF